MSILDDDESVFNSATLCTHNIITYMCTSFNTKILFILVANLGQLLLLLCNL